MMNDDRLFPAEPTTRAIARRLFQEVRDLPILSPHGHTDPRWFAENSRFPIRATFRDPGPLCVSHALQPGRSAGGSRRAARRRRPGRSRSATHLAAFRRALPSLRRHADPPVARPFVRDLVRPHRALVAGERRPPLRRHRRSAAAARIPAARAVRALQHRGHRHHRERAGRSRWHEAIRNRAGAGASSPPIGRTPVVDPDFPGFRRQLAELGAIAGEDTTAWYGYLAAHRKRRAFFRAHGATATDHGHPSAATADLAPADARGALRARDGRRPPRKRTPNSSARRC